MILRSSDITKLKYGDDILDYNQMPWKVVSQLIKCFNDKKRPIVDCLSGIFLNFINHMIKIKQI